MSHIIIPAPTETKQYLCSHSGDINDLDFEDANLIIFNNPNAGCNLSGLKAGKPGQMVTLKSARFHINMAAESGLSQPENRLQLFYYGASMTFMGPTSISVADAGGTATFIYDGLVSRWRMTHFEQGAWQQVYNLNLRTRGDPQPDFGNQAVWVQFQGTNIEYLWRASLMTSPGLGIWWWPFVASGQPGGIGYYNSNGSGAPPYFRTFMVQGTLGGGSPSDPFQFNFEGVYLTDCRTSEIVDSNYITALGATAFTLSFKYRSENSWWF